MLEVSFLRDTNSIGERSMFRAKNVDANCGREL
jgi:hypothetical protein